MPILPRLFPRPLPSFARRLSLSFVGWATWLPVVIWFNSNVVDVCAVNGASMYPFLNEDMHSTTRRDLVVNWKWNPEEGLQKGMVVTFRSPNNPETTSIKRIIALEGEYVRTREPYPQSHVRVPVGHVWVEGDGEAGKSLDSNYYGPIAVALITGRVTHILFPFRKFGRIKWEEFRRRER